MRRVTWALVWALSVGGAAPVWAARRPVRAIKRKAVKAQPVQPQAAPAGAEKVPAPSGAPERVDAREEKRTEQAREELSRRRYSTGQFLYDHGRYAEAMVEFEAAKAASNRPGFEYNIALCLKRLGRAREAADAYERFLVMKPDDAEASQLRREIARLRAEETSARVPVPVKPEKAQGFLSSPIGQASLAVGIVGGACLAAGAATGTAALLQKSDYHDGCQRGACDDAQFDQAHNLAITTDALLATGMAAAAVAIGLAVARTRERRISIAPVVGRSGSGVTLSGAF